MDNNLNGELIEYKKTDEIKDKTIKQSLWNMAIGLQTVDNLKPSIYLKELSKDNIEGKISIYEIENLLKIYYENKKKNKNDELECDLVSTRIVELLNDNSFNFHPTIMLGIHEYLFKDIYSFAGKYRAYNITKEEPILNGNTVNYASYDMIEKTLNYDFNSEKEFNYANISMEDKIKHISLFTSSIWQVHPFGEGNGCTEIFAC